LRHHVYLVPGFFGFANFGDFRYFAHAREHLEAWSRARGIEVAIHYAPTFPTASLRRRAGRLIEIVAETAGDGDEPIHLIGHSTGGLDARLAVAPRASLLSKVDPEPLAARVRTVIAVASPHYGAPTAAFFASLLGQRILFLLSLVTMYAIRIGTIPLPALVVLASALGSAGAGRLMSGGVIQQVYDLVLKDFSAERRAQIEKVFSEVRRDQTLLVQLTPEGLDLFNALATERDGVRRGCVVAQAKPPTIARQLRVGPNPTHQAMYNVFRALYAIASTLPEHLLPVPNDAQAEALIRAYGRLPSAKGNDAMVPTRSQVWGEVVHAAWADHLDVIGHFHAPERAPLHVDWMRTMSDFGPAEFEAMWNGVARFVFRTS
jgi:triacylglycerol lipase